MQRTSALLDAALRVNPFTNRLVKDTSQFCRAMCQAGVAPSGGDARRWYVADADSFGHAMDAFAARDARSGGLLNTGVHAWHERLFDLCGAAAPADRPAAVDAALARVSRYQDLPLPPKLVGGPLPAEAPAELTVDQAQIVELAMRGLSLFIGGHAGTGKTALLRALYHRFAGDAGLRVGLAAMTGAAALNVGGLTFHSLLGVSPRGRWDTAVLRVLDVLIVDEVSMLSAALLEELDRQARAARQRDVPFGGVQVVLCGDVMQLPNADDAAPSFASPLLEYMVRLQLVAPLRQACPVTRAALGALRSGFLPVELEQRGIDDDAPAPEGAVHVFPRRREAAVFNQRAVAGLQGEQLTFTPQRGPLRLVPADVTTAIATLRHPAVPDELRRAVAAHDHLQKGAGAVALARVHPPQVLVRVQHTEPAAAETLLEALRAHPAVEAAELTEAEHADAVPLSVTAGIAAESDLVSQQPVVLREGCRVMVTRNLSGAVVNGSLGTVEGFAPPTPELLPDPSRGTRALYALPDRALFPRLPVVRLDSGLRVQIPPTSFTVGGGAASCFFGYDVFTLPLMLGYGFTIHKVQGLTIDAPVLVDCREFFDCPHLLYVACSRVRHIDQLTLRGVAPDMARVDKHAAAFSHGLQRADGPVDLPPHLATPTWVE